MTTLTAPVAAPARGWRDRAAAFLRGAWEVLEDAGRLRAAAELRRAAALHARTDPELAARLRAAAKAD